MDSVAIRYAAADTGLGYAGLIGFSRATRRSVTTLQCVVKPGAAARAYFTALARLKATGAASGGLRALSGGFEGDIWCLWNDEWGFSMTCNGQICDWTPGYATVVSPSTRVDGRIASSASSGGGYYHCGGNGCEIYALAGGGYGYECESGGDPGSGGGGGPSGPPQLGCSQSAPFGSVGGCTVTIPGVAVADDTLVWTFTGTNSGMTLTVIDSLSSHSWTGTLVSGGTVSVSFKDSTGTRQSLSGSLTVSGRSWSWASAVSSARGADGDIDACFDGAVPLEFGLTASAYCTSANDATWLLTPSLNALFTQGGAVAAQVGGGGPNDGLWYIASASATMTLRMQIRQRLRASGSAATVNAALQSGCGVPATAQLTILQANACYSTATAAAFTSMVADLWSHESQHAARAITAAAQPLGDFRRMIANVVAPDSTSLDIHTRLGLFGGANDFILNESLEAHKSMSPVTYQIWDQRAGWLLDNITVHR